MDASQSPLKVQTEHGDVSVATRAEIQQNPAWRQAFANRHKDHRYYEIVEETLHQGFEHRYFVLEDKSGNTRAIQPFFLLDQDLLQGSGGFGRFVDRTIRRGFPRCLKARTLMVGCAAGEGHLDYTDPEAGAWVSRCLHAALKQHARNAKAALVVLKEFPSEYRGVLSTFARNGYARVPSLPMIRLNIRFDSFETYMSKVLSKVTRKNLRRKFRAAAESAPIEMSVVDDVSPYAEELYPLYLQVYERSALHFEKLTPEFLRRLGRDMPDKARFFIWRQNGKAIAFSICLIHGDSLHDEYLGLDYSVALDLHLYFVTLRDVLQWAMERGYHWYCSTSMGYDPKLHMRCELAPLDLYVAHTSPIANFFLRRILPWMEPTRGDKTLKQFPNYNAVWGDA